MPAAAAASFFTVAASSEAASDLALPASETSARSSETFSRTCFAPASDLTWLSWDAFNAATSTEAAAAVIAFAAASSLWAASLPSFFDPLSSAWSSAIRSFICFETASDFARLSCADSDSPCSPVAAMAICSADAATVTDSACSARWRLSRASSCLPA